MHRAMRRLVGASGLALAATLAIAPAASAHTDDPEDGKPAKPAGVVLDPQPLVGVRIAIDPGHGGVPAGDRATDTEAADLAAADQKVADGRGGRTPCSPPGSVSPEGYTEHEFTYEVSQKLAGQLRDRGAIVLLTRTDDGAAPCVDDRGTFALDQDVDLMLSIHSGEDHSGDEVNAGAAAEGDAGSDDDDVEGGLYSAGETGSENDDRSFQVVIAAPPLSDSQRRPSHDLAESMAEALENAGYSPEVSDEDVDVDVDSTTDQTGQRGASGRSDRSSSQTPTAGATADGHAGIEDLPDGVVESSEVTSLNFARRPAVRLELGNLRDGDQAEIMSTDEAQVAYADALSAGVLDWVEGHRFLSLDRMQRR